MAENINEIAGTKACDFRQGPLPVCAPLATGYVPFQQENPPRYEPGEGLTRGTLFPGLDLPWNNVYNTTNPYENTALGELMALGFAMQELGLYLDTHGDDKEALKLFTTYAEMMKQGQARYAKMYGPIVRSEVTTAGFTWLNDPWPWEYAERLVTA